MTPGSAQVPVLQLNNGVELPARGFGVFQTPPEQTVFGFDLTADQLVAIDALDTDVRGGPEPEQITRAAFGREISEA